MPNLQNSSQYSLMNGFPFTLSGAALLALPSGALWWPKVKSGREGGDEGGEKRKGGILAGHDYTAARAGVPLAVNEFADARGLKLRLTGVQRPRRDVRGNQIPPCCPSWYIEKP